MGTKSVPGAHFPLHSPLSCPCPAMAMDLASPLFPRAFLAMACLGSLARAVTGVAGGATRAALTQHFARQSNAADIAAKEQSQARMGSGRQLGRRGGEKAVRAGPHAGEAAH